MLRWSDLPLIRSAPGSYIPGGNGTVTRIVVHRMEAPMRRGTARGTANYFAAGSGGNYVSAHVCVDPGEAVRCLDLTDLGYHAPPNGGSIGIEFAGYSADDDWATPDGESMLAIAANVCRAIAAELGVDPVWLVAASLLAGRHGHTSHAEVSQAWHQSDHWDPGPHFPVDHFLDLVRGGPAPAPTPPAPSPQEDDDMPSISLQPGQSGGIVIPAAYRKPRLRVSMNSAAKSHGAKARVVIFGPDSTPRPSAAHAPKDPWHVWIPNGSRVLDQLGDGDLSIDVALDKGAGGSLAVLVEDT
jgi:hypothetical protein